ncbi:MAG: RsmB/NOP family class I SAM-dependent RNA methyltransferase [Waddliaceae bacterium]|jgi:16S rRNA (cytosine967-C5)-methyltransferase|nr:RsmB/NOP family class I SAM-dependent RNA methyltransferase [Waddliaceae bacterium]MBT3578662.1 RsmB/NOP family class I SAM-dependent RNA methyltransferase [Waddliaceae bacterium]MBT4445381.1 RsmB/NOP family class I SAM-dependent RNA methyltransferase [Waddliaceae bacterium]MBT6928351.1 RsmB/NOP family class I SAM-dependent RNA methyltransferase [Waddliaceae bacterium]MBT7265037.1 RsmB/NOP family class I SAM-dependent RNA methyltransferase [Waddliaceae bacterium]
MTKPFREYHLLLILEEFEKQHLPLDRFISNYFRANKACGSKDRRYIVDTAYNMMRWRGLLDGIGKSSWTERLDTYKKNDIEKCQHDTSLPEHVRCSFPKDLFDMIADTYGKEQAAEICLASNSAAPTTVRVNTIKISRDDLFKKLQKHYEVSRCKHSTTGITFNKRINFLGMEEFKEGLFEVQDEGSQLVSALVKINDSEQILDYCAGAGGKALAIAATMNNKGQIFLHDVRDKALAQAKKRLKRAGVNNCQIVKNDSPQLKKLKKNLDWVVVDAPCSGSGTWRRNAEMKWKTSATDIENLVGQQRHIFEKALSFMAPKGYIVYITCSIFPKENELQIKHFSETYNLELVDTFKSQPTQNGMDGFFGATLRRK